MISREVEIVLAVAVETAKKWRHEYITLEHILYALLQEKSSQQAIEAVGGDTRQVIEMLEGFFSKHLEPIQEDADLLPQPTAAFQRVLQRAADHVISAGKDAIYSDSLLVSILGEKGSYACYFLNKQNISSFDLINYFSHGTTKEGLEFEEDEYTQPRRLGQASEDESPVDEEPSHTEHQHEVKKGNALKSYTTDLVERAKEGKIDPLIGRNDEVERTIQILSRRRKNNPLFVGEAGVGKTAIAEGLALKIAEGNVPESLRDARIYSLDMGTLLAGSKFRGDFEQRLKALMKQLKKNPHSILFIDEIHTIIGAGAVSGSPMDASNILKPALSSGEIRCIGSTTFKEYRQHFEGNHALSRRFQVINVAEPSIEDTVGILAGLKDQYEKFHNVKYSKDSLSTAVELSVKYLRDKRLPDKAIDIIDEVGAFKALKQKDKKAKPMMIKSSDIKTIISKIARIPVQQINSKNKQNLQNLGQDLKGIIFGQDQAIDTIESSIRMAYSGLANEDSPIGSFLFAGPTGVGKTELAKQLAKELGVEFLRFDMSEYMEKHAVSRLIGAPPGYVGYDEGGLLTDAVNKNPYAVLLLDEIEKAHSDIHNILLQVMDHGTLTDSNGRETNFRNLILIMTTNVGAKEISQSSIGFSRESAIDEGKHLEALNKAFTPEFRNRIDAIVSFKGLEESIILKVVDKFLMDVEKKLILKKIKLDVTQTAKKLLAKKGYDPAYGARPLNRVIQNKIKKPLADDLLFGKAPKGSTAKVDVKDGEFIFEYI